LSTISSNTKKDIRQLNLEEIKSWCESVGEKSFRAKQLHEWLWQKTAHSFDEMTNLSKDFRILLNEAFIINPVTFDEVQKSNDGTIKSRFKLFDDHLIEGVLIPSPAKDRMTACISSQVGCSLTCKFCATGQMKRMRNLTAAEIVDQVVMINEQAEKNYNMQLSNIVYMGMGEPLLNYKNVLKSVELLTSPTGRNISPRRLTISTAGIAKAIRRLADDEVKFNLALSLHAADDEKRSKIMPINEQNSLEALGEALQYFYEKTNRMIYFEYILFKNFNDTEKDAHQLADFCKLVPCKVNIIEYNTVAGTGLEKATEEKLMRFQEVLLSRKVRVTFRRSRGKDIDAACGQLANK